MKVKITASNTSFVSVGDITEIITNHDGTQVMWSDFCKRYTRKLRDGWKRVEVLLCAMK